MSNKKRIFLCLLALIVMAAVFGPLGYKIASLTTNYKPNMMIMIGSFLLAGIIGVKVMLPVEKQPE